MNRVRLYKAIALASAFITMLGLSACDNSTQGSTPSDQTSVEQQDDTGTYGPYMRPDGSLRSGIDMGGGLQYNIQSGQVEFGYGF